MQVGGSILHKPSGLGIYAIGQLGERRRHGASNLRLGIFGCIASCTAAGLPACSTLLSSTAVARHFSARHGCLVREALLAEGLGGRERGGPRRARCHHVLRRIWPSTMTSSCGTWRLNLAMRSSSAFGPGEWLSPNGASSPARRLQRCGPRRRAGDRRRRHACLGPMAAPGASTSNFDRPTAFGGSCVERCIRLQHQAERRRLEPVPGWCHHILLSPHNQELKPNGSRPSGRLLFFCLIPPFSGRWLSPFPSRRHGRTCPAFFGVSGLGVSAGTSFVLSP